MAPGAGWLNRGEGGKGLYPLTVVSGNFGSNGSNSVHALRDKITFIQGDGLETLKEFSSTPNTVAFVDPPYVAKGRGAGFGFISHYDVDCHKLFG